MKTYLEHMQRERVRIKITILPDKLSLSSRPTYGTSGTLGTIGTIVARFLDWINSMEVE
jgi:hypothetical protein